MSIHIRERRIAIAAALAIAGANCAAVRGVAQTDFVTAVTATHPVAYYRLDAKSGKSVVGSTTYKPMGGVTSGAPGAPVGAASHYAQLNGRDAYIVTTQAGGVTTAASIMAWVNLAELPSKLGRLVYVAGESEVGNDLDLQFDTDNAVKFWTAAGGHVSYSPPPATLVDQWHMVVVTLDTVSLARAIYWDGKPVAADKGGGSAGKKSIFTIGASPVFSGRNLMGGVEEVALWNRALKPAEVAAIYATAKPTGAAAATGAGAAAGSTAAAAVPGTGPFAAKAKIEVEDAKGPVHLKREKQIAYMFLSAIEIIEHECQLDFQHVCTFDQMLSGSYPKGAVIEHLKFDPNKTDPNYTYTVAANGMAWEAHANPKKPGLAGMCSMSRDVGTTIVTYNPTGNAGWTSTPFGNRGMEGDSFATQ